MEHLWGIMEDFTDAMSAEFAHHREAISLCVFLNSVTNVAKLRAGANRFNTFIQAFLGHATQALGEDRCFTDKEHFACIAVVPIFDDGNVDIKHIAGFQLLARRGDAVAYDMID